MSAKKVFTALAVLACASLGSTRALAHPHAGDPADPAAAAPASTGFVEEFIYGAKPTLGLRARIEFAKQNGRDESVAHTLRGRLGILSGEYKGFQAFAEYEHTSALDRRSYQAASAHGLGQNKTVIADPENNELNRVWLQYKGYDSVVKAGRQRIKLDNDRFIGNVGWRQNEQTYDAIRVTNSSLPDVKLDYTWMYNVQRIFTEDATAAGHDDFDSRSHLINASWSPSGMLKVATYAYLLDLNNAAGSGASSDTLGVSVSGKVDFDGGAFSYWAEAATQSDADDSLLEYDVDYYHLKGSVAFGPGSLGIGYEQLGSDKGMVGFATPLATLHAFNGFADKFLTTPATGLEDKYIFGSVKLPAGFVFSAWYHEFEAEDTSDDFGYEYDFVLKKPLPHGLVVLAKAAFYQVDPNKTGGVALTDTQRLWLQVQYTLPTKK